MTNFTSSPAFGDSSSYSKDWASRYGPADDGSCGENVAVAVLTAHDIPIIGAVPAYGRLCGIDINNMPAADAISFSAAENMKAGKFIEVYCDADGFAYFTEIYPNPPQITLNIRTCIPTSNIDQKVDLVIVRGYEPPPVRTFKPFVSVKWDGPAESLSQYITHNDEFKMNAWRSYFDPVLETSYMDGIDNLYELEEFESLLGYAIDFSGNSDVNVKYSFSGSTTKNINCSWGTQNLGSFAASDKYGDSWPLLSNVQGVYAIAYEVVSLKDVGGAGAHSSRTYYTFKREPKFITLPTSNWHWELTSGSAALLHTYSNLADNDPVAPFLSPPGDVYVRYEGDYSYNNVGGSSGLGSLVAHVGGAWILNLTKMWAAVELDRPSVNVTDPSGNALGLANSVSIKYQPIIVIDVPAPVAYNMGGSSSVVDHTLDLYDTDPSTVQPTPSSLTGSMAWLQTQTAGKTVDISLPFADEGDCEQIASVIYEAQNESIISYNMVLGPEAEPVLGAKVAGYEGRINRISESFQDSSSYTINVNVGPTFVGPRGWNAGIWQRKTENVSRPGIIVSGDGGGVNYRVKIQGMGVYHGINKTLGAFFAGEKVSCTIYNNPVED